LANLLGNAWKFTAKRPRATIEFGCAEHEGETVYSVRDDGAGFDATYADKLFGAFQRLHSTSEFEGAGIGLATVPRVTHRLVAASGPKAQSTREPPFALLYQQREKRQHNGKIILLVEDSPDDALLTLRALKKNNILNEVVVVNDGAQALDYLFGMGEYASRDARVMPQLVLLDLQVPNVEGLQVLRRLRNDSRTKLLPVVILTSSDEEQDIVSSYQLGANSYIRKPVDSAQFTEAVQQLRLYWLVLNQGPPSEGKY
jgi:CheY-like chemotaxis protein